MPSFRYEQLVGVSTVWRWGRVTNVTVTLISKQFTTECHGFRRHSLSSPAGPNSTQIWPNLSVYKFDMAQTSLEFVKTYAASFATLFGTPSTDDRDTSGASSTGAHQSGAIYLNPARRSGARLVLLPLLPPPVPKVDLPSELWRRCITFAMDLTRERATASPQTFSRLLSRRRDLVLVSKMFKVSSRSRHILVYSHLSIACL